MKTQAWSWKAKQIWPKCLTSFTSLDLFKQRLSITTYHFDKLYKTLKILTRRVGSDCRKENANRWSSPTNLDSCLMGGAWCQTEIWTESQLPLTVGKKKKKQNTKSETLHTNTTTNFTRVFWNILLPHVESNNTEETETVSLYKQYDFLKITFLISIRFLKKISRRDTFLTSATDFPHQT